MAIFLLRHGPVQMKQSSRIKASDMSEWVTDYREAPVADTAISAQVADLAQKADVVICSTEYRALESCRLLGRTPNLVLDIFREAELPYPDRSEKSLLDMLKLKPGLWCIVFRLLWFAGYSQNSGTIAEARARAVLGAQKLTEMSVEGHALLIGHGIMNRLIASQLQSEGWQVKEPGQQAENHGVL